MTRLPVNVGLEASLGLRGCEHYLFMLFITTQQKDQRPLILLIMTALVQWRIQDLQTGGKVERRRREYRGAECAEGSGCLLYTSDAADE